jgi:hypothetical protein
MQMQYHGHLVKFAYVIKREIQKRRVSEPECATTLEQVRVTTGSKQSHSVEPNLVNSKILKKLGTRRNKGIPAN